MRTYIDGTYNEDNGMTDIFGKGHPDEPKAIYPGDCTKGEIGYCNAGRWAGWIFWRHPDGQWVSLAKIPDDKSADRPAAVDVAVQVSEQYINTIIDAHTPTGERAEALALFDERYTGDGKEEFFSGGPDGQMLAVSYYAFPKDEEQLIRRALSQPVHCTGDTVEGLLAKVPEPWIFDTLYRWGHETPENRYQMLFRNQRTQEPFSGHGKTPSEAIRNAIEKMENDNA